MTVQRDVLLAIKAMIVAALPAATVVGFDGDASAPEVIPSGGLVIGHGGDPGEPEIDLSPITYHYEHQVAVEVAASGGAAGLELDVMLAAIGARLAQDRTLGGLCSYLEARAPQRDDETTDDVTINWADVTIVAHYSVSDPLA